MKHFADEHDLTLKSLRVMAEANDPFFIGTPAHYKQAEWFLSYWQKFGDANTKVHLRRIHYRIVSLEPQERRKPDTQPRGRKRKSDIYENTYNDWQYLITASKYARYLDLIDPELIIDQRSPEPGDYSLQYIPERPSWDIEEPGGDIPSVLTDLTYDLNWQMPEATAGGYKYNEGLQPYHVEIWIEKSTMDDVLIDLCKRYHVGLVTGVGFNSVTTVVRLIRERLAKDSRPCRILYISDFDPAGREMPRSMSRQVEFWLDKYGLDHDVRVNHLLLTQEQVEHYQLPRIPVKKSDKRRKKFEKSNGEGQVELEALEALRPGEFEQIVKKAILQFRDAELADAIQGAEEEANDIVTAAWGERVGPYQQELNRTTLKGKWHRRCRPPKSMEP